MKSFKLAAIAVATVCCSSAFASTTPDLKTTHLWNGFYLGVNAGGLQDTSNITDTSATTFNATIQQTTNPDLTGGFQVGYRHAVEFAPVTGIYGIEFSTNFTSATYNNVYGSPFALYQLNITNELKNLMLLQFVGGIAVERTLLFLAAGFSWSNLTGTITSLDGIPFFNAVNLDNKVLGSALSGGIEYAINPALSVRLKVDYVAPNSYSVQDSLGDTFQLANRFVQGTVGLNYNFG